MAPVIIHLLEQDVVSEIKHTVRREQDLEKSTYPACSDRRCCAAAAKDLDGSCHTVYSETIRADYRCTCNTINLGNLLVFNSLHRVHALHVRFQSM